MHVLHVIPAVAPRYGGPSVAVMRMCAALRADGVEVMLAATDADGPGRLSVETGTGTFFEGIPAVFFASFAGESLKVSPGLGDWLGTHVAAFDVVHIHGVFSYATIAAGRAAARVAVPYVVRPLGQLDPWSLAQGRLRKKLFLSLVGDSAIEGAARMHWTAEEERRVAPPAAARRPAFVVPLGVEEELFDQDPGKELARKPVVLFLSRLHEKKNVKRLIDAFLDVVGERSFVDWSLRIAGEGEAAYVGELQELVRRRGAEDRVQFAGWLSGEEKRTALREAALLALPSSQENFGIAVAEAMVAGTPVLVSEAVALASDVRRSEAGWVVALEEDALRCALVEVMSSSDERRRRGAAARALAESRFRWSAVARRLVAEYERIVAERRAA